MGVRCIPIKYTVLHTVSLLFIKKEIIMKRILLTLFFAAILCALLCICASAEIYSGRALDVDHILGRDEESSSDSSDLDDEAYELAGYYQVQYELNTETGVLRIFCGPTKPVQKMLPYAKGEWVPWTKDHMRPYIKTAIIEEGILSVGRFSFAHCENLETVYIPHSVLRVDQTTFWECPKLKTIYYAGNEADFNRYVEYQDVRNSYTGGAKERKARDMVVFGESVTIVCRNQDGEVFDTYTVGGYAVGDTFTITPKVYEGPLTFVGENGEITGKFKKGEKRQYEHEYTCAHEYYFKDETVPCSSICMYCECADPAYEDEHDWVVAKDVKRGLFHDLELDKKCNHCGLRRQKHEIAYGWYVATVLGVVAIITGISLLIALPIRRKKKMKNLTW